MKKLFLVALITVLYAPLKAQNKLNAYIKEADSKEPLIGATAIIVGTSNGASADANGFLTINNIPDGKQAIRFSFIGFEERVDTVSFPFTDTLIVFLEGEGDELEEVTVSSTRSSRTIKDIPTRIEFIAGEELDEKGNMKPGDIRMVLAESTGIQTQQTSATSANSSIRIQGLDGRYTQILKDGFPLFSGYSGGLGLLQTPPLDLKQIEVVKGSASTLYGGGAIAGLVNLISKTPSKERELRFLVNGTSAKGLDVNTFYGKKFGKMGVTLFASYNSNAPYDPAGIDLTAIPKFERYTFNPKLFFDLTPNTTLILGVNTGFENRIGGDIHYIKGKGDSLHSYFESNKTQRLSSQFDLEHRFGKCSHITLKNSYNSFNRSMKIPGYEFNGTQNATFTELTYANHGERTEWVTGLNLWTDDFKEKKLDTIPLRNYNLTTAGAFVQNLFKATKWLNVESGLRVDYVVNYEPVVLPRLSLLFKINPKLTSRLGGGLGYKAPTIFTEESERIQYRGVLPINSANKIEKSYGANWDFNYRTSFADGKVTLSFNQLFFYTILENPLLLALDTNGLYHFTNANGQTTSQGLETNIKIGYKHFKLFLGYTYTDTRTRIANTEYFNYLTPPNKINSVLFYEVEDKWKIGLEAYYFDRQRLSDGKTGRDYWVCGFMTEKLWEKMSIYVNFENFLDARQTRFDSIYTGSPTNPVFRDVYAPLDGFVFNGGIKIKI